MPYQSSSSIVWCFDGEVKEGSCVFVGTDNTSAVGWTYELQFAEKAQEAHTKVSRRLAQLAMENVF